jgi:ADP-ribose pyrophosphatase YjhB (NUDIX family)
VVLTRWVLLFGEAPADAASREALEESGYDVGIRPLLGAGPDKYAEPDGSSWPTINLIHLSRIAYGLRKPSPLDPSEVQAVRWVPIANPPDEMAFASQQLGALRVLDGGREVKDVLTEQAHILRSAHIRSLPDRCSADGKRAYGTGVAQLASAHRCRYQQLITPSIEGFSCWYRAPLVAWSREKPDLV